MSLILDALRKADAERERGAVPGLHAQPAPPDEPAARAPNRTPPWLWAGVGVAVGLAVAVALFAVSRSAAPPEPAARPSSSSSGSARRRALPPATVARATAESTSGRMRATKAAAAAPCAPRPSRQPKSACSFEAQKFSTKSRRSAAALPAPRGA